jgi:hypothetical protein
MYHKKYLSMGFLKNMLTSALFYATYCHFLSCKHFDFLKRTCVLHSFDDRLVNLISLGTEGKLIILIVSFFKHQYSKSTIPTLIYTLLITVIRWTWQIGIYDWNYGHGLGMKNMGSDPNASWDLVTGFEDFTYWLASLIENLTPF